MNAVIEMLGYFGLVEDVQAGNTGIRWYVERGPVPQPDRGFHSTALATGQLLADSTEQQATFDVNELRVARGDFIYFVVDAMADGRIEPHTGDATRFNVAITARDVKFRPAPDFEHDVLPLLAEHCQSCHRDEQQQGGLDLRSLSSLWEGGLHGFAIEPGHPENSRLIDRVRTGEMPPDKAERLTFDQVELLWQWIRTRTPKSVAPTRATARVDPTADHDSDPDTVCGH